MAHILIILDAIESLEDKSAAPPTEAQANLLAALQAADEYTHEGSPPQGVVDQITECGERINAYIGICADPPTTGQDVRLNGYADELNNIVPG